MYRYKCRVCGGNCDAGDLRDGVCPDCIAAEEAREERDRRMSALLLCSTDGQMMMEVQ